jgi:hypothetical protein
MFGFRGWQTGELSFVELVGVDFFNGHSDASERLARQSGSSLILASIS